MAHASFLRTRTGSATFQKPVLARAIPIAKSLAGTVAAREKETTFGFTGPGRLLNENLAEFLGQPFHKHVYVSGVRRGDVEVFGASVRRDQVMDTVTLRVRKDRLRARGELRRQAKKLAAKMQRQGSPAELALDE